MCPSGRLLVCKCDCQRAERKHIIEGGSRLVSLKLASLGPFTGAFDEMMPWISVLSTRSSSHLMQLVSEQKVNSIVETLWPDVLHPCKKNNIKATVNVAELISSTSGIGLKSDWNWGIEAKKGQPLTGGRGNKWESRTCGAETLVFWSPVFILHNELLLFCTQRFDWNQLRFYRAFFSRVHVGSPSQFLYMTEANLVWKIFLKLFSDSQRAETSAWKCSMPA